MKLILALLVWGTFGRYLQMRNFRKYHQANTKSLKTKSAMGNKIQAHAVERFGSAIDKAARREYYLQKVAADSTGQNNNSRDRFNRWFSYFNKY